MPKKLKILVFIKPFWKDLAKHKGKLDMIKALEGFSEVMYWYHDGDAPQILDHLYKRHKFHPDLILHYDNSCAVFAPKISGLSKVNILKGYYVMDTVGSAHEKIRTKFIEDNKVDLIFSVTKEAFLKEFPQYKDKFRWFPFSINPNIYKDWGLNKDINYLLMGLVNFPSNGIYPFRESVLKKMEKEKGFIHHQHPGHTVNYHDGALVNEKYAQELNRAKIFFTCGSIYSYPVLKFFEAPACRTLLLAEPNQDMLDLGFIDGVNFVSCNKNNFYEKARYYLYNVNERNRITENGFRFIHENHTNKERAKQFIHYVFEFIEKK